MLDNELIYLVTKYVDCINYFSLMKTCKQYYTYLRNKRISCLTNPRLVHISRANELSHKACISTHLHNCMHKQDYIIKQRNFLTLCDIFRFCNTRVYTYNHQKKIDSILSTLTIDQQYEFTLNYTLFFTNSGLCQHHIDCYFKVIQKMTVPLSYGLICSNDFAHFCQKSRRDVIKYIVEHQNFSRYQTWLAIFKVSEHLIPSELYASYLSLPITINTKKNSCVFTSAKDELMQLIKKKPNITIIIDVRLTAHVNIALYPVIFSKQVEDIKFDVQAHDRIKINLMWAILYYQVCIKKRLKYISNVEYILEHYHDPTIVIGKKGRNFMKKHFYELVQQLPNLTSALYTFASHFGCLDTYIYLRKCSVPLLGCCIRSQKILTHMLQIEKLTVRDIIAMSANHKYILNDRVLYKYIIRQNVPCSQEDWNDIVISLNSG